MHTSFEDEIELIRIAMENDMGEPQTPREIAEHKVAMAVSDAWLATAELVKLRSDPIAREFFGPRIEGDLWSIWTRVATVIDDLRAEHGERPLPRPLLKVVRNG